MKLRVSPAALRDLKEIEEYISFRLCSPVAAKRIIKKITDSYKALKNNPYTGKLLQDEIPFHNSYRYIISGNYLIFYKINEQEDAVEIYSIIYGKRDYVKFLFKNELNDLLD